MSPGNGSAPTGLLEQARKLLDALDGCQTSEEQEALLAAALRDQERDAIRRAVDHLHGKARERRREAGRRASRGDKSGKDQAAGLRTMAEAEVHAANALWTRWRGL
jgi:hypothetical protein